MTRKTRFLFRFEKQKPRTRERQAFPWSTRRGGGSHCSLAAPPGSATAISNYVDNFIMLQAPSVRAWPFGFSRIQTVRTRVKRRHERHASITAFTYHVRFEQLSHFPASFLDYVIEFVRQSITKNVQCELYYLSNPRKWCRRIQKEVGQ